MPLRLLALNRRVAIVIRPYKDFFSFYYLRRNGKLALNFTIQKQESGRRALF